MPKVIVTESSLENIASAIRVKNGLQTTYKPSQMAQAILALSPTTVSSVLVAKTVTANKIYDPAEDNADGYSLFTVNVPQVISAGRCPRSEQTTGFQYGTLLQTMSWKVYAEKEET